MQSPLITIPPKTTTEVDLAGPLRQLIGRSFGADPGAFGAELAALDRARTDAVGKGAGSEATQRDLLFKYFGQLELLELRFPELKVAFTWNDAFTLKPTTQSSLAFEKASVLFLLGATLSSLAASSARSSPDGLKRAYNGLRAAAGLFVYINDNFLHAPSTDLSKELVKYLVGLTTAQAQEVFLEKVESEGRGKGKNGSHQNPALVARLAVTCAQMYAGLGESVKAFFGKGIVDRNWVALLAAKAKHFGSVAHFYRSQHDANGARYGDVLVRLTLASTLAKEAGKLAQALATTFPTPAVSPTLPADAAQALEAAVKAHTVLVEERRVQAQKENDLIYHAILPAEATLPPIEPFDAAQPVPIQETYASVEVSKLVGSDPFARLVPLAVHEQASVYSEEKAKLGRAEQDASDEAEAEVAAGLASLGLPEAVNRFRALLLAGGRGDGGGGGGFEALALPTKEALGWAGEINGQEREEDTAALFGRLDRAKRAVERDLAAVKDELDGESRECERLRAKHGSSWTQPPSASLTKTLREDLRNQQAALASASESDERIGALYGAIRSSIGLLQAPAGVGSLFRSTVDRAAAPDGVEPAPSLLDLDVRQEEADDREKARLRSLVGEVEERLGRLHRLRKERTDVLKELKELIQNDDVSQQLLLNRRSGSSGESSVFAAELEKFQPLQARAAATVVGQRTTVEELGERMQALTGLPGAAKMLDGWERAERAVGELMSKLESDIADYREVRRALKRGLEFYSQLQTMTDGLRRSVRTFLSGREDDRKRLLASVDRAGGSVSSPGAAAAAGASTSSSSATTFSNPYAASNPYANASSSASSTSTGRGYTSPPPPASNPYDFAALGKSLLPAFGGASSPPPPQLPAPSPYAPSSPYGAPAPHSSHSHTGPPPSQQTQQRQSSYPPPPPASPYSAAYPPPPGSAPSPYGASPPGPPAQQRQQPYNPYGSLPPPPPQHQHQQGSYGSAYAVQPPPAGPYGAPSPSPYGQPAPPVPPPGSSSSSSSPYGAPLPPPPQNPSQYAYRG